MSRPILVLASLLLLTASAASAQDTRRAVGSLANVTRQCVACHAAYRVH